MNNVQVEANIPSAVTAPFLLRWFSKDFTFGKQPFMDMAMSELSEKYGELYVLQNSTKLEERWNHIRSKLCKTSSSDSMCNKIWYDEGGFHKWYSSHLNLNFEKPGRKEKMLLALKKVSIKHLQK